jgi:Helix-turn-helix domain
LQIDMAKKPKTNTPAPSPDDLLTAPQAAEIAGVHRVTFSRRLKQGKGPPFQRVGSSGHPVYVVRRGDLLAWLAARDKAGE